MGADTLRCSFMLPTSSGPAANHIYKYMCKCVYVYVCVCVCVGV